HGPWRLVWLVSWPLFFAACDPASILLGAAGCSGRIPATWDIAVVSTGSKRAFVAKVGKQRYQALIAAREVVIGNGGRLWWASAWRCAGRPAADLGQHRSQRRLSPHAPWGRGDRSGGAGRVASLVGALAGNAARRDACCGRTRGCGRPRAI
ncbi:MAG: hypothetical protein ABIO58_06090, partial [Luteimonas sp.]